MRIRDNVVGDISVNKLEERVIRTPTFQRLHRIKQLGNAFHIYPGAMHTRFEHSLGVYYQVQRLLGHASLTKYYSKIPKNDRQIIRLVALLHDIIHTPFRHTLDRDSKIIHEPNRAEDYRNRIDQVSSEMKSMFSSTLSLEQRTKVLEILKSSKGSNLDKPCYQQLVEDTLSADLLDYTLRDCYNTGLKRSWDSRIYDHISIASYNNKPHVVANLIDDDGNRAQSAVTEIINLIDIRYTLNERVYFYGVKIAADALLIKAVRALFDTTVTTADDFMRLTYDMSDEEFINLLITKPQYNNINYAQYLKDRRLPIIAHEYRPNDITDDEKINIAHHCFGYDSFDKLREVENTIAENAGVSPENVIVYFHDLEMQSKKKPDFLIVNDKSIQPKPIGSDEELDLEIQHIAIKQEKLWRCYIFSLDRRDKMVKKIKSAAKEVLTSLT